jgi:phosphoheptose isomerase
MSKNKFPVKKYRSILDFSLDYSKLISSALQKNFNQISFAALEIEKKKKKKNTNFVCGNGGSSAIANHFVCDYLKGLSTDTNLNPKVISLNAHSELISAISNDIGNDEIFSFQASKLVKKNDLIILFSSSGNSNNIKKLLQFTKKNKIKTIGFSGFGGGYLKKNSNISIHVDIDNYGITEDVFHIYMHIIMQFLKQKNLTIKKIHKIKF